MSNNGDRRLGRGLAALIGEMDRPVSTGIDQQAPQADVKADRTVAVGDIVASRNNPRRQFNEAELAELAGSLKEHGLVQPILVRPTSEGHYEIIAGERRWRAAQAAKLDRVPVIVREVDDRQALELAIIENVQRSDLNPVEEALGYQLLMEEHDYRQADLGQVIGKSRSHVANTLRLLNLPADVREMVTDGRLSAGHARALVPLDNPRALADRIVREGLSVRQAESLASLGDAPTPSKDGSKSPAGDIGDANNLAGRLSDLLGMKVDIRHKANDNGTLTIRYRGLEQLDELEERLSGKKS
jgi:ParB family chromosome partitioning protein